VLTESIEALVSVCSATAFCVCVLLSTRVYADCQQDMYTDSQQDMYTDTATLTDIDTDTQTLRRIGVSSKD
jgi:hypothetical protein